MSTGKKQGELIKKYQALQPKRKKGINVYGMKNSELIKLIQRTEGNAPCFGGDIAGVCGHTHCAWYEECKNSVS